MHASAFGFLSATSGHLVSFDMVAEPDDNSLDRGQASVAAKFQSAGIAVARGWKLLGRSSALAWALRDGAAYLALAVGGIALAEHSVLCADTSSQKPIRVFCFQIDCGWCGLLRQTKPFLGQRPLRLSQFGDWIWKLP